MKNGPLLELVFIASPTNLVIGVQFNAAPHVLAQGRLQAERASHDAVALFEIAIAALKEVQGELLNVCRVSSF